MQVIIADPTPLIEIAYQEDVVLFSECQWKVGQFSSVYSLFLLDGLAYRENYMIVASYTLWKKSSRSLIFLIEWLTYMEDMRVLTGAPINGVQLEELPEFSASRHDMTPLAILGYKWGIDFRRSPAQWGNPCIAAYNTSKYGQIFQDGHR